MELVERWPAINPEFACARDYRKEIERFVLWLVSIDLTLATVGPAHIAAYRQFLTNPEPSSIWVVTPPKPRTKNGVLNSEWRPFAGPLQQSSAKQAASILHGFFEYMVAEGHCVVNPCRRLKRSSRQRSAPKRKSPNCEQVLAVVFDYCRNRCSAREIADRKKAIRDFWLLAICYLTGLGVTEVLALRMSDLFQNQTGWWLRLGFSGSTPVAAPVGPELLMMMQTYRQSVALSALPRADEHNIPLVGDSRSGRQPLSRSAAYKIALNTFKNAAVEGVRDGVAQELHRMTPSRFHRYTLLCINTHLSFSQKSLGYTEGLRGLPSPALMQLSLQHSFPRCPG